ncbi:cytosine permease [Streptomyces sp. L7]
MSWRPRVPRRPCRSHRHPSVRPRPRLTNEDLAPADKRNWKVFDLFAMWMSDVPQPRQLHLRRGPAGPRHERLAGLHLLLVGFVLIYVGMNWMGRIGQAHGVPFPVVSRISFGVCGRQHPGPHPGRDRHHVVRHPDLPGLRRRQRDAAGRLAGPRLLDSPLLPGT